MRPCDPSSTSFVHERSATAAADCLPHSARHTDDSLEPFFRFGSRDLPQRFRFKSVYNYWVRVCECVHAPVHSFVCSVRRILNLNVLSQPQQRSRRIFHIFRSAFTYKRTQQFMCMIPEYKRRRTRTEKREEEKVESEMSTCTTNDRKK